MSVTFTRTTQDYDPLTGAYTSVTGTVAGTAMRVRGRPDTYRALSLIDSQAPTLFFVPGTYGECPAPGDTVVWESVTWTVRDVERIAPDGVVIAARVIVTR